MGRLIQLSGSIAVALFWVAVVACAIAQVALIVAAMRAPAEATPEHPMRAPSRAAELGWVALPAVVLAVVLLLTWRAIARQAPEPAAAPGVSIIAS